MCSVSTRILSRWHTIVFSKAGKIVVALHLVGSGVLLEILANLNNTVYSRYASNEGPNDGCRLISKMSFLIRNANPEDIPQLHQLIDLSIRQLSTGFYTPAQIEGSVGYIFGPDTQLIADSTYFVAIPADNPHLIVGCGGKFFPETSLSKCLDGSVFQPKIAFVSRRNASNHQSEINRDTC